MTFNLQIFFKHLVQILPYLKITFLITFLSLLFALLLGGLTALGSMGRNRIGRAVARGYVTLMRCVPPIVLLFVVYYGSPYLVYALLKTDISELNAVCFAVFSLSLLHGATCSEMMRSAFGAVDRGQKEAALSIGLNRFQAFYRILFPQAFVVAIPILGNTVIGMLRDGALAYSIGVVDITGRAQYLISMNLGAYVLETHLALALIYWILSILTQKGFQLLEHRMKRG